jgi:hypothetical protein
MIRIGRRIYNNKTGSYKDPQFPNFKNILVLTKSTKYGSLGPYVLKDEKGRIMENIYQKCKVYEKVPKTVQRYSRYDNTIIWNHPYEIHVDEKGNLTPEYWNWRKKLSRCEYHIRYPVGFNYRSNCLYALKRISKQENGIYYEKLDYIQARKEIYMPVYIKLAKKEKQYNDLLEMLKKGINILIIEVDSPHQEDLEYYKEKYGVDDDFIVNNTMICNKENIDIMLNDPKHPFGHGYCLGISLFNDLEH